MRQNYNKQNNLKFKYIIKNINGEAYIKAQLDSILNSIL